MELIILVPVILLMGGVAIYMALNERPLPAFGTSSPSMMLATMTPAPRMVALSSGSDLALQNEPETYDAEASDEPASPRAGSRFTQTDVLLADALTEMIGLKAELFRLRSKVENLNTQVARLAGEAPTPPAASKRPVLLRKAA